MVKKKKKAFGLFASLCQLKLINNNNNNYTIVIEVEIS